MEIKVLFCGSIKLILKLAFLIVSSTDESKALEHESRETRANSSLSSTFNFTVLLWLITIGLTFKLCCAIGVIIILFVPGAIIGPPQQ